MLRQLRLLRDSLGKVVARQLAPQLAQSWAAERFQNREMVERALLLAGRQACWALEGHGWLRGERQSHWSVMSWPV